MSTSALLGEILDLKYDSTQTAAARKLDLLTRLAEGHMRSAEEVFELHEALCFLRAYPPDAGVRELCGQMLESFDQRKDLKRFAKALVDTGIAGTRTDFRFYWLTAIWLADKGWARNLTIDWPQFGNQQKLPELLHLLLPFSETLGLDSFELTPQEWIQILKSEDETDAGFLIQRFESLAVATPMREKLYEDLDIPLQLAPGPTTPARGRDEWSGADIVYGQNPSAEKRPDMKTAIRDATFTTRRLEPREARHLIDLANSCMVARHRDLLVFLYADPNDAQLIDFGDGMQCFWVGAVPERRLMLESVYGCLTLMNGYPIGYVLCSALFGSAEVAYNIFETFRGRGAAHTYARVLAMVHRLFGADTFAIDPYQLGHNNDEGLESGAWWFYYKLGFRPHDTRIKRMVRKELHAMKKRPKHRTSKARLNELASEYMFLHMEKTRSDVLGRLELGEVGLKISQNLAARFGGDRERGIRVLSEEATARLGMSESLTGGETLAWERWAPLVDVLPGIEDWSPTEKADLVQVILAKGGRSEAGYVALFDQHARLREAVGQLAT